MTHRRPQPEASAAYEYDAEADGANCAACPLRDARAGGPVPSKFFPGALGAIVAEAPGADEVRRGEPLIGPSGVELMNGLSTVGSKRSRWSYINALSCQPPKLDGKQNNLRGFLHRLERQNKGAGREKIPTPFECCRPRFLADLATAARGDTLNVIALGGTALEQLTGRHGSIQQMRGGPLEHPVDLSSLGAGMDLHLRILPTVHPAFVLRARRWTEAFHADLGRAVRWFETGLGWKDPQVIYHPTPAQVRNFLALLGRSKFVSLDVETAPGFSSEHWDLYDPDFDKLRCLGLGTADGDHVMVVPFRSKVDPRGKTFYSYEDGRAIVLMLREFFTTPGPNGKPPQIAGWNVGSYDRPVIRRHFAKVDDRQILDGIGLHKFASPELPHDLGYAGSVYTDVHSWKAGHVATEAETDEELWRYNALDVSVTARTIPQLAKAVKERKQVEAYSFWQRVVQPVCAGLHHNGIPVDDGVRRRWEASLTKEALHYQKICRDIAGQASRRFRNINLNSTLQLRDLLFDTWNIIPHDYTALGDPSTGDESLREFIFRGTSSGDITEDQIAFIKAERCFREKAKWKGTYVTKLRRLGDDAIRTDLDIDEDLDEEELDKLEKRMQRSPGRTLADGRVHGDWLGHGTVGWRMSSSKPNCQNFPSALRDIIRAPPGWLFIGCDEAQLELRKVAGLALDRAYLDVFAREKDPTATKAEKDPHYALCVALFGDVFLKASKEKQKELRVFVKQLTYASLYRAEDETKHRIVTSAESERRDPETGELLEEKVLSWSQVSLSEIAAFTRTWLDLHPAIPRWWAALDEEFARQGYLAEPIFGQRCDFLDGDGGRSSDGSGEASKARGLENKLANFKPQSGGAALVHIATDRLLDQIPFEKWGPGSGLILNGHDQLVIQVPDSGHAPHWNEKGKPRDDAEFGWCPPRCRCTANRAARYLEECMTIDGNRWGLPVQFLGEATVGKDWAHV